jgi:hypothetical protein
LKHRQVNISQNLLN